MIQRTVLIVAILALSHVAWAGPCEEFTAVNEGWKDVMSRVSEYEPGEPLDKEERRALTLAIADQSDGSEALPWSFDDAGDERGMELADQLVKGVKSLALPIGELHDNNAALAESLEDIAEALEAIGKHCARD